jgi:hypothetical protein
MTSKSNLRNGEHKQQLPPDWRRTASGIALLAAVELQAHCLRILHLVPRDCAPAELKQAWQEYGVPFDSGNLRALQYQLLNSSGTRERYQMGAYG